MILADWAAVAIDDAHLYEISELRRLKMEKTVRGLGSPVGQSLSRTRLSGWRTSFGRLAMAGLLLEVRLVGLDI